MLCLYMCSYGRSVHAYTLSLFVLVHLLPVTGATTLNPRPPPAAEAVPGGRRRQLEGEDGRNTLQSWRDDTAGQSPSHFSLCPNDQPCRWEDTQRASLTPKANESEFPHRLSDCSFTVLDSCRHFSQRYRSSLWGLWSSSHLLWFLLTFITGPGCAALQKSGWTKQQDGASSSCGKSLVLRHKRPKTNEARRVFINHRVYSPDGKWWDV